MKQGQIILRFLFPSRQDAAKAVHPTVGSLHHPAASPEAGLTFDGLGFFASGFDMGRVSKLLDQIAHRIIIVAFVQAKALAGFLRGFWTFQRNTLQRVLDQLAIVSVGTVNRQANGDPVGLSQQTSFNAFFGPVRRI